MELPDEEMVNIIFFNMKFFGVINRGQLYVGIVKKNF